VSGDANGLNSLCWNQATAGVELEAALADCNASLELKRTAPTLDSRGFVELRLGKFDAALRDFNEALQMKPQLANSLYGRAIVKASKGQKAEAERDKLLALRVSPLIVQAYESYGLLQP
jgi:tetratricopeptide (TPR) repeat protein